MQFSFTNKQQDFEYKVGNLAFLLNFIKFQSFSTLYTFPLTQLILLVASVSLPEAASQSSENAEHNDPVTAFKKDLRNQNSMR